MTMKPDELRTSIKGVVALVMTPFKQNEDLDEAGLREGVKFLVDKLKGGNGVLLTIGSTGEFYAMNDEENKKVAEIICETANGEVPVIVGTGRGGTRYTIEMSRHAQSVGADGVMVVPPFYHPATREGIYRHISKVAESIDIGLMLYNNPVTSKTHADIDLVKRLSKIPNVVADKENTPNVAEFYWMQKAIDPNDMVIISGPGEMLFQYEALYGSPAYVTCLPNFVPDLAVELAKAGLAKDVAGIKAVMDKIEKLNLFQAKVAQAHGPVPYTLGPKLAIPDLPVYQTICKEAMNLIGLPGGIVREPMESLTAAEKAELKTVLADLGVL